MKFPPNIVKDNNDLKKLAGQFSLVGDSARLQILCVIFKNNGACVSEITDLLGSNIAIISHHLQVLSSAGLLVPKRQGKRICYHLSKETFLTDLKRIICKYKLIK